MTNSPDAWLNHVLAALPEAELSRWRSHPELMDLPLGYVLYEAGDSEGNVTVLDRPGVEAMSCACYEAVKAEYDRLLPARIAA